VGLDVEGRREMVGEVVVVGPAVVVWSYRGEWMQVSRDRDHNEWMKWMVWMYIGENKG